MILALFQRLRSSPTGLTALTGYAAMLSTLVVGVFSVPLALRFLTNEEFGLWSVVGQSLGYLLLLDFGVSWSASRMLVGPLREGNKEELSSWWTVIVIVLCCQGLLVAGLGFAATDYIINFFKLSKELIPAAEILWGGMILINAIQLPFRAYTGILYCQDRWYVMHLISILTSWINLIAFAALLLAGYRTSAYLVASGLSIGANALLMHHMVRRSGTRLRLSMKSFDFEKLRILFRYSSGLFLLALAAQITFMTQSIIIGKVVGLEAVAAFVVSSKSLAVVMQLVKRAFESFSPRWMQLYVSGDKQEIWNQWRRLMAWLLPAGMIGALGILIFNRSFSMLYGGAENHVNRLFDLLLAAGLVAQIFINFTSFVFPISARIKGWCLAGLGDAVIQVVLGILFTRWYGSPGLLIGTLLGPLLVSVPYLVLKAPGELGISRRAMASEVARTYGLTLAALAACFFVLNTPAATPAGWWPSNIEIILGLGLAVLGVIWFCKFRVLFFGPKRVEA